MNRMGRNATFSGLVALATAAAYVHLAQRFGEGGGAFAFLRQIDRSAVAGSVSSVLLVGDVMTVSVYAFTFGHYLAAVVGWKPS
jgi:amino acid transporter